jgi:hypothetical protein
MSDKSNKPNEGSFPQHKRTGLKMEACVKGSKKEAKSKKNRIFVGGIPIDLVESKSRFCLLSLKFLVMGKSNLL